MKIAEDTAAAATSDVPYAKERVAMMLTILKRFMVQAGASGKYHKMIQGFRVFIKTTSNKICRGYLIIIWSGLNIKIGIKST